MLQLKGQSDYVNKLIYSNLSLMTRCLLYPRQSYFEKLTNENIVNFLYFNLKIKPNQALENFMAMLNQ